MITKEQARLYLQLLEIAYEEGGASEDAFALGRLLRDEHFPGTYRYIFESDSLTPEERKADEIVGEHVYPLRLGPVATIDIYLKGERFTFREAYPIVFAGPEPLLNCARYAIEYFSDPRRVTSSGLVAIAPFERLQEIAAQRLKDAYTLLEEKRIRQHMLDAKDRMEAEKKPKRRWFGRLTGE